MKNIIGKKYVPFDNSWSIAISKVGNCHEIEMGTHDYLAGTQSGLPAMECTILTNTFKMAVGEHKNYYEFIIVECNGEVYTILFHKDQIIDIP